MTVFALMRANVVLFGFLRFADDLLYGQYAQIGESDATGRVWRIGRWSLQATTV